MIDDDRLREAYWGPDGLVDRLWAMVEHSSDPGLAMAALETARESIEAALNGRG